jgi:anti-anti-sigma factor
MSRPAYGTDGVLGTLLSVVEDEPRTFRLAGELDVSTSGRLGLLLEPELEAPGDVTLDLQGLEFMDSAAIHLFIKAACALRGRGNLRLLDPSSHVARVIETTGLERLNNLVVVRGEEGHLLR